MYMKVNTSLYCTKANHIEDDEDNVDTVIFSQGSLGCHQAIPVMLLNTSWFDG
jgi:hypothetical protein